MTFIPLPVVDGLSMRPVGWMGAAGFSVTDGSGSKAHCAECERDWMTCPACQGWGEDFNGSVPIECDLCEGSGEVMRP